MREVAKRCSGEPFTHPGWQAQQQASIETTEDQSSGIGRAYETTDKVITVKVDLVDPCPPSFWSTDVLPYRMWRGLEFAKLGVGMPANPTMRTDDFLLKKGTIIHVKAIFFPEALLRGDGPAVFTGLYRTAQKISRKVHANCHYSPA